MQTNIKSFCFGAVLFATVASSISAQSGGSPVLLKAAVAGGGAVSTNGVFALSGTIGQPVTEIAAGGRYTLQAGFWHGLSVIQTPGQPILRITLMGTKAVVSWPVEATGFVLEETTNLASGVWTPSVGNVVDTPTEHTFTVRPGGLIRVFRLRKSNP